MPAKSKKAKLPLQLLNSDTATFDCTFGRGCEGDCCTNGRPGLRPQEQSLIRKNLHKILPLLKPEARKLIEKQGIVTRRTRDELPLAAVIKGWCVYFNQGCALHKAGAVEGDALKYKPRQCAVFPLLWNDDGQWYVRQWGYEKETWDDLHCLNPNKTSAKATETLKNELNLAATIDVRKAG